MEEAKEILVGVVQKGSKVLIIKRATHNKYDPGRWEFVSVFVKETDIEKQAVSQVKSETGLNVKLIKVGNVFKVEDEYGNWLIHPFLFMPQNQEVKIDKDHTDYRWVTPGELIDFDCVKDLDGNLTALD